MADHGRVLLESLITGGEKYFDAKKEAQKLLMEYMGEERKMGWEREKLGLEYGYKRKLKELPGVEKKWPQTREEVLELQKVKGKLTTKDMAELYDKYAWKVEETNMMLTMIGKPPLPVMTFADYIKRFELPKPTPTAKVTPRRVGAVMTLAQRDKLHREIKELKRKGAPKADIYEYVRNEGFDPAELLRMGFIK